MKRLFGTLCVLIGSCISGAATPLAVSGSSGTQSFSAVFENIGNGMLQITLTNTGQTPPSDESGVIGALFFNLSGNPTLTPVSMSLGAGSSIVNGSGDPSANWRYDTGISGPGGATQGVSAAGLGIFGSRGNFCSGANCGNLLHGIDWGLVDASYIAGSGNSSISGQPLIQDTAIFVLSGVSSDFNPSTDISNVSTNYTATLTGSFTITATDPPAVPEPSPYFLLGGGMIVMSFIELKRHRTTRTLVRNR